MNSMNLLIYIEVTVHIVLIKDLNLDGVKVYGLQVIDLQNNNCSENSLISRVILM